MRFSPLTKADAKKNGKLFIVTLILGFLLRNNQYYITTLHEINHLLAVVISGNIPMGFMVNHDGSGIAYYFPLVGLIPGLTLPVRNFVGVSGPGFAYAAPFMMYILGLKIHLPGIAGFWIAGAPRVFADWGRGTDFQYVVDDVPWMYLMFILAGVFLILSLWSTYYVLAISIEHQERLKIEKQKREAFLAKLRQPSKPRPAYTKQPTNLYGSPQIPSYKHLELRKSIKEQDQLKEKKKNNKSSNNSHLMFQTNRVQQAEYEIVRVVG
jgi:hypothetical protein